MLIDCFGFLDEFDLLEGRIKYLWDVVDLFVVIEGNTTFSGTKKPYNLMKSLSRLHPYVSKMGVIQVDNASLNLDFTPNVKGYTKESAATVLECYQRNSVIQLLKGCSSSDLVMIGDLDEIPGKDIVSRAVSDFSTNRVPPGIRFSFQQTCFYYNFHQHMEKMWSGTVMSKVSDAITTTPQTLRDMRFTLHPIYSGWHLSYFMTPEKIVEKLKSFVHQEYNQPPYTDIEYIKSKIRNGEDIFGKEKFHKFNIDWLPKDLVNCFKMGL